MLEGNKPYNPTRLEWLAMEMNVRFGIPPCQYDQSRLILRFVAKENNTITICFVKHPNADIEKIHRVVHGANTQIMERIVELGWQHWINVEILEVPHDYP